MSEQTWLPHPDDSAYLISSHGQIQGVRGRIIKPTRTKNQRYLQVHFRLTTIAYVHHLVARTFLGSRPEGAQIRHLNGDHLDNRASNLAYGSARENAQDALQHGTHWPPMQTHCSKGHPYDEGNTYHWKSNRYCRECGRQRQRAYYQRLRGQ